MSFLRLGIAVGGIILCLSSFASAKPSKQEQLAEFKPYFEKTYNGGGNISSPAAFYLKENQQVYILNRLKKKVQRKSWHFKYDFRSKRSGICFRNGSRKSTCVSTDFLRTAPSVKGDPFNFTSRPNLDGRIGINPTLKEIGAASR